MSTAKLKRSRAQCKSAITRIETFFRDQARTATTADAHVRLRRLEEVMHSFEEIQAGLEELEQDGAEGAQFRDENANEREFIEQRYFTVAAMAQTIIDRAREAHEERIRIAAVGVQNVNLGGAQPQTVEVQLKSTFKLPDLKLPEFDGEFTKWMVFKNSFETTIHNNAELAAVRKHQYLLGQLRGEARNVIETFDISEENYAAAWKLLNDTYDNKIILIQNHLEELFNFPTIPKEDKADGIRKLVWHIQTHIASLKALNQPVNTWDTIIIHLARKHLEYTEQKDWQMNIKDRTTEDMPKLEEFLKFLTERCQTLRILNQNKQKPSTPKATQQTEKKNEKKHEKKTDRNISLATTSYVCKYCSGSHPVNHCEEFTKLSVEERRLEIMKRGLCPNCFTPGHMADECRSSSCKKCGGRHNTLIHRDENQTLNVTEKPASPIVTHVTNHTPADTSINMYCVQKAGTRIILSTAQVYIKDTNGRQLVCRALLDPGSQLNLVTSALVNKIKLSCKKESRSISGVNQSKTNTHKSVNIQIRALHNNFTADMECLVLPVITEQIPQTKIDVTKIIVSKHIQLANPVYNEPGNIDLLIGAGLYWKIILGTPHNRLCGQPALQNTKLGWILGGELEEESTDTQPTCLKVRNVQLHQQIGKFWKQEVIPETHHYTEEEKRCEEHFSETTQRDDEGRFIVRLPTRPEVLLGESRKQAYRRLESVERKFKRNIELREAYHEFMDDYLERGHMSLVKNTETLKSKETYFIPHQAIVRPESITTKLRVVFDASAETTSGTSLNDKLMTGPNLQNDLFKITTRFRTHEYVLTADISQMFRQIMIHPDERSLQLILWRKDPESDAEVYQLNTVTYGTACAPYHAMRCLRELATIYEKQLPEAAEAVNNDFYMDDVLTGAKNLDTATKLQQQLTELLMKGQFLLRKWRSNDPEILQHLAEQGKTDNLLMINKEEALKTLGLLWNSSRDQLEYQVKLPQGDVNTKRLVLSRIAQIFDPLGLVSPVLIKGKMLMQKLWSQELDWDQALPESLQEDWNEYYLSLPSLNELQIPRNVNPKNIHDKFDLFGFGDASESAFGACLYAVSVDGTGNTHSQLLCSKSKVAPLKTISLPRLELEAALLLVQLYQTMKTALSDRIADVRLWSDSTIVLGWIRTEPKTLKTFVANRIAKIQEITEPDIWKHVSSEENPADVISRGCSPKELKENILWWHGPSWLREGRKCPDHINEPTIDLPELKKTLVTLTTTSSSQVLRKYSSYSKLRRVVAYCHRFRLAFTPERKTGPLEVDELDKAEKTIVKWTQADEFSVEYRCLKEDRQLPRKSPLNSLSPFIDNEGLIRVGGRLRHAEISEEQKHQFVLPARNHVTTLIMREQHVQLLHCPPEQLLHSIRQRFWPISGRREAQKIVRGCLSCFRFRPAVPDVIMGDLPADRVTGYTRPFAITGVDYAGPIQIRESKRRGRMHIYKGYVAVFVCFSTKAIHLELVTELTTEAFLATLRRFTARRGLCYKLHSDNGTNFTGSSRELEEIYDFLKRNEPLISESLSKQRIKWEFIPPRSPHLGGLWEAAVKIMKRHLNTVTQKKVFTYEEYNTLLVEIEAILNSRPLTPISNDPSDIQVLTPAHFLIGDSLLQPVQHNFLEVSENRLSRWQHLQKMKQQLWSRWQREYLQELQKRNKWQSSGPSVELGSMVLMIEDNVPPLQWHIGKVVEIHPGADGEIRVVTVKTATNSFRRSIKRLCPLPMSVEDDD